MITSINLVLANISIIPIIFFILLALLGALAYKIAKRRGRNAWGWCFGSVAFLMVAVTILIIISSNLVSFS